MIDGIRGGSSSGDAALDDFTFQHGHCHQLSTAISISSFDYMEIIWAHDNGVYFILNLWSSTLMWFFQFCVY